MRKLFLIGLLGFSMVARSETPAHIHFDIKKHDFGNIDSKVIDTLSFDFIFKNTGDSTLFLQKVDVSCGCTKPEWTKKPIKKGETGVVKISFNSKTIKGKFLKSIFVKSNADNHIELLKIEGEVIN